jgi:glycosyltransferase involved in cell wall biosynthesis
VTMPAKKILLLNDASFLATGFGAYGFDLLSYLHQTGKYELAELGCYAKPNDSRQNFLPWKFYGNLPMNNEEENVYRSLPTNQFGEWKFEEVCLDFRPNIVIDFRDAFMMDFIQKSPARPYFDLILMPTVDGMPQYSSWITTFQDADKLLAWTDWCKEVLEYYDLTVEDCAPPGINVEYQPIKNKKNHKKTVGLSPDMLIIGTVMRNQKRKLFPDLMKVFSWLLEQLPEEISRRLYLYLHTSYPDKKGWDIPKLLLEYQIGHRTLFSYVCTQCNNVYPNFFQDSRAYCKYCKTLTLYLPRSHLGVDPKVLNSIYNLFDVYVQYANCEGFGIPSLEAAACGIPGLAIDYSAMGDIIRKVAGFPVKVKTLYRELDSHTNRAIPDNDDCVRIIKEIITLPESLRLRLGAKSFEKSKLFSWKKTGKTWETIIDSLPDQNKWIKTKREYCEITELHSNATNTEFLNFCINNIIKRPDLMYSNLYNDAIKILNHGHYHETEVNRKTLLNKFHNLRLIHQAFEEKRNESIP